VFYTASGHRQNTLAEIKGLQCAVSRQRAARRLESLQPLAPLDQRIGSDPDKCDVTLRLYGFRLYGSTTVLVGSFQLLTPWPEGIGTWIDAFNAFQSPCCTWIDAFNAFQSSCCRAEVEGAFGALVKRWAVLQKNLNVSLPHATLMLEALVLLPAQRVHDGEHDTYGGYRT
jgi:hypothetical protein